jgi:PAS domain S-box-containing protein
LGYGLTKREKAWGLNANLPHQTARRRSLTNRIHPPLARYGIAVAAVGLALVIKLLLDPLIGEETPFLLFFAAVMAVAYFGGLGPGLVATGLAALVAWYFFLFPLYSFRLESFGQGLRLVVFVLEGTFVSLLSAAMYSARLLAATNTRQAWEDRESLHESEERYRFLAEAGAALSFSLDYRVTLTRVAHLAVPQLADWCAVDVLGEDGSLERLAVAHQDPEKVALAYELQERYPPDPDASYGVPNVLRTGEPEMMSEIPPELVKETARDAEHREILRRLRLRSYVVVPLITRGRTLGTIAFVMAESGRRYGDADLKLAEDLARRAAVAIDNARLYEEAQREIAEREQAEEELRSSRDQLEIILGGVADGITAQDPTGRLIYANEAAARIVGYPSADAFVQAPLREVMQRFEVMDEQGSLFPLENLPGRRALQGEEGAEEVVCFRVVATGEEWWSVVRATPVFDQEGQVRFAVNIFRDITERRRVQEVIERQARYAALGADVGSAFAEGGGLSSILQGCAQAMVQHLDATFARVWILDEQEGVLELQASAGMYTHRWRPRPRAHRRAQDRAHRPRASATPDQHRDQRSPCQR